MAQETDRPCYNFTQADTIRATMAQITIRYASCSCALHPSSVMDKALTNGYSLTLTLKSINPQEFMSLAVQACRQMGWTMYPMEEDGVLFYTQGSPISYQEEIRIHLVENKATITSRSVSEYLYDQQQNVNNILAFRSAFDILHNNFLVRTNRFVSLSKGAPSPYHINLQAGWGALIPSETHKVTPVLIYLNVLILLAMTLAGISPIDPKASSLLAWGGNFKPLVMEGEYWRLITYMFLHGGLAHLLGNLFALLFVGLYLEPLLGKARYLSAYILTGIVAGLASMMMHGHSVGVGASGAIFGLYGVFLALLTARLIRGTQRQTLLRSLLFFIIYALMMGLQGNTDNAAHIGGLLSGILIGLLYLKGLRKPEKQKTGISVIAVSVVLTLVVSAGIIYYLKLFT